MGGQRVRSRGRLTQLVPSDHGFMGRFVRVELSPGLQIATPSMPSVR